MEQPHPSICTPSPEAGLCPKGCLGSISGGAERAWLSIWLRSGYLSSSMLSIGLTLPSREFTASLVSILLPCKPPAAETISRGLALALFARNTQNKKNSFLPFCLQKNTWKYSTFIASILMSNYRGKLRKKKMLILLIRVAIFRAWLIIFWLDNNLLHEWRLLQNISLRLWHSFLQVYYGNRSLILSLNLHCQCSFC